MFCGVLSNNKKKAKIRAKNEQKLDYGGCSRVLIELPQSKVQETHNKFGNFKKTMKIIN